MQRTEQPPAWNEDSIAAFLAAGTTEAWPRKIQKNGFEHGDILGLTYLHYISDEISQERHRYIRAISNP